METDELDKVIKAAELGDAHAQYLLGVKYENGKGVDQIYEIAVKWHTLAANQGHADAQFSLGAMYNHGNGVPKNFKTSMKWYLLAAEQGNADAQLAVGQAFRHTCAQRHVFQSRPRVPGDMCQEHEEQDRLVATL